MKAFLHKVKTYIPEIKANFHKMSTYLCEHWKIVVTIFATVLIVCTGLAFTAPVILAKMQPVLSEELKVVSFQAEKKGFEYTGKEITPKITEIIFKNEKDEKITKKPGEFKIEAYIDNIDAGKADVEISLEGYQGTLVIKDVFMIFPAQAGGLQIISATREAIDLSWNGTVGAEGYSLFKSTDGGHTYSLIAEVKTPNYQDTAVLPNALYEYFVCAYMVSDQQFLSGKPSDTVKQYTPLEIPAISAVKNVSYNTLCAEWPAVAGAVGYRLYRSDVPEGEYTLISEITDGAATSYSDTACECGKVYYYYVQAAQMTDTETIYGEASGIVSGNTTPEHVSLSGTTANGNTKVTLNWKKASGAQGYEIYRNNNLVATIENADTLSWSEEGLAKDSEHSYKVRAYCTANNARSYGSFSAAYAKDVTIEYNYGEISAELAVLTQYVDYSYVYGGTSPSRGWDCSGFTQYVFKKHFGISIGRTSGEQARQGTSVSKNTRSEWQPGDLLFYQENGRIIHVAIYLGNGQMIHALNSKYDTLIQDVDYYEVWDKRTSLYCVKRYW